MRKSHIKEGLLLGIAEKLGIFDRARVIDICELLRRDYERMPSTITWYRFEYNPATGRIEVIEVEKPNIMKFKLLLKAQSLGCEWAQETSRDLVKVLEKKM
ncbi:MAG: hypothetical protein ACFFE4_16315 [Candidatus Thorarchaeota archaeon]